MQCINAECGELIPNDVNYCAYCGAKQLTWDIKMDERMMVAGLHSDDMDMFYSFFIVGYHLLHLQYQLKEEEITPREAQLLYARACQNYPGMDRWETELNRIIETGIPVSNSYRDYDI